MPVANSPTEPPDPSSQPTVVSAGGRTADEGTVVWSAPPPPSRFPPGLLLAGRFRIAGFLGQGGMGDVYEAEDQELRERVALKTVRPAVLRVPGVIERFRREVQLARKVTHPNVCRLFDVFHHRPEAGVGGDEVAFFTMELLAGETLDKRLRRDGPMDEAEALPIVRQMADGLAAAHRVGVVHRDFKSANVMLVPEDGGARAVVTDFGLAHGAEALSGGLTLHGDVLGTPEYMAPEQVTGGEITPKTDVYALGIVLYEMVTGSLPFLGESALATAAKRLREDPPPPRLKRPGLAPAWEASDPALPRPRAGGPLHHRPRGRHGSGDQRDAGGPGITGAVETKALDARGGHIGDPSRPRR